MKEGKLLSHDYASDPIEDWPTVTTRGDALQAGLKHYFTGRECKRGHLSFRGLSCRSCIACRKSRDQSDKGKENRARSDKRYMQSDKGKAVIKRYKQSEKGKNCIKAYSKVYNKAYSKSEKGTLADLKNKLGADPPPEYVTAIHQQRLLKRELRKLKQK